MAEMELTGEVYPKIVRWRDREFPVSWYELVLDPKKLHKHLQVIKEHPDREPTAVQLITTFLDKGEAVEGGSCVHEANDYNELLSEKTTLMLQHALLIASSIDWDLHTIENGLLPAVQYSLFCVLKRMDSSRGALCLYHQWFLRYYWKCDLPVKSSKTSDSLICSPPSKIALLVFKGVPAAKTALKEFCSSSEELSLPFTSPHEDLPPDLCSCEGKINIKQVLYDLARAHFKDEEYETALNILQKCQNMSSESTALMFSEDDMEGLIAACQSMVQEEESPLLITEKALAEKCYQELVMVLLGDAVFGTIPEWFRGKILTFINELSCEGNPTSPPSKQAKMSDSLFDETDVEECTAALRTCVLLYNVLEATPSYWVWQEVCRDGQKSCQVAVNIILKWNNMIEDSDSLSSTQFQSVQYLIRCIALSLVQDHVDLAQKLVDSFELSDFPNKEPPRPPTGILDTLPHSAATVDALLALGTSHYKASTEGQTMNLVKAEKELLLAKTAKDIIQCVGRLYELVPLDQVDMYSGKFESTGSGYVNAAQVSVPALRTKYNVIISKASWMSANDMKQQNYRSSLDLYRAAVKLLESGVTPSVRSSRLHYLHERVLAMEVGHANSLWNSDCTSKFPVLIEKAKAFLQQSQSDEFDLRTIQAVSALLLNAKEYNALTSREQPFVPGRVFPRLAIALATLEKEEPMRKPIRDLFEAVLSVFTSDNNLSSSEVREMRSAFEVFIDNLWEEKALSLLLSAIVRLFNMIAKPSVEICCDFTSHWPTAIGSQHISDKVIARYLQLTLDQGLRQHPHKGEWIVAKGDLLYVQDNFGVALKLYLEALSLSSNHFIGPFPASLWTLALYQKMLACCLELCLPTQAIILSQSWDPVDYERVFLLISDTTNDDVDLLSKCIWDMTIIEYLIYTYNKQGDSYKRSHMVRLAGQPVLNTNNSPDILEHAKQTRRKHFFSELYNLMHTS